MTERIALFPLGLILLPGMRLPLHIFEERYRLLINECVETHKPFGIVYYNGSDLRRSGCSAEITSVLKRYDDGRLDVMIGGIRRFQINALHEDRPFLEADALFFDDVDEDTTPSLGDLAAEALDKVAELARLSDRRINAAPLSAVQPPALSFLLAGTDILNAEEKQESLESTSTSARLQNIITAAQRTIDRIRSTREIKRILGTDQDISHMFN